MEHSANPNSSSPVDSDDDQPCFRHPQRLTALQCISCERPICTECAVTAPVGLKCRECSQQSRSARGKVPASRLAIASIAGLASAVALGFAHRFMQVPFLSLILAWLAGRLIGAATRAGSGGFRDAALSRIAVACTIAGFGVGYLDALMSLRFSATIWSLVYIAVAAFGAYQQSDS